MNWLEKYIPTKDQLLLPLNSKPRKLLTDLLVTHTCPYRGILLHDTSGGSGKTTFIDTMLKDDYWVGVEINDTGERVKDIANLKDTLNRNNIFGTKYLVYGNEISRSHKDYREGLRGIMDKHHQQAFFIFTDNKFKQLELENPQLFQGQRVKGINYAGLDETEFTDYCQSILDAEGVSIKAPTTLAQIVTKCKPSIRAAIQEMETSI